MRGRALRRTSQLLELLDQSLGVQICGTRKHWITRLPLRGISEALAAKGYDLLLTFNTDGEAAAAAAAELRKAYGCAVELVACGGAFRRDGARADCFGRVVASVESFLKRAVRRRGIGTYLWCSGHRSYALLCMWRCCRLAQEPR